jgi:membrane-bound serine protease (ClpP class)
MISKTMPLRRIYLLLAALCLTAWAALAQDESTEAPILDAPGPVSADSAPASPALASSDSADDATSDPASASSAGSEDAVSVYVIPINEAINKPNLFILRRGLKEAIENEVDMVLLEMDTPGGRVDYTLEMMEMLAKFDGITATFVNSEAISAGSFIAAATREIYFAPDGLMGASAVIQGGGQEVPESAKQKIDSYLRANIRILTKDYPFRSDVIRAMLDADFELKIGEEIIKPAGELLTLTASEAMQEYGDPPVPLLGKGIHESVDELLDARFGPGNYVIRDFEITYSEVIAKWMSTFAPALLGIGMLMLFFEFKTPGFGVMGIGGIVLLGVFFASQYIAGLAGNEPVLFFALGIILVLVELFFFPGIFVFAMTGLAMIFGSLLWAMVDFWPGEPIRFSPDLFAEPLVNLIYGLAIAVLGAVVFGRFFKGSWIERRLVLEGAAGGHQGVTRTERVSSLPETGAEGIAITDLFPSGRVEVEGRRYEARSALGSIEHGSRIRVKTSSDFGLVVEALDR